MLLIKKAVLTAYLQLGGLNSHVKLCVAILQIIQN